MPSPSVHDRAVPLAAGVSRSTLGVLLASALLGACGGDGDGVTLGTLSIDEDLPATTVTGAGPVAGRVLPSVLPAMPLDIESTEAYATGEYDYITSISIDRLSLAVRLPESEDAARDTFEDGMKDDLSFFSKLEVFIVATIDGERRTELLGGLDENDPALDPSLAATTLALDMTGIDILDFVEAEGGYEVRIQVNGSMPPDDVVFDGEVEYGVGVGFR